MSIITPTVRKTTYRELRKLMYANRIIQADICAVIGRSETYVSQRFSGERAWELDDCYRILDWLQEPAERLHEIFPWGGKG